MIKQIKEKILLASLFTPVLAVTDESGSASNQSIDMSAKGNFADLGDLSISNMIKGGISLVLIVVTVVFFFILVIGGLKWITSGGDEKKVAAARAQITNALIGLAIVFASWAILALIKALFNVDVLGNFSLPSFTTN